MGRGPNARSWRRPPAGRSSPRGTESVCPGPVAEVTVSLRTQEFYITFAASWLDRPRRSVSECQEIKLDYLFSKLIFQAVPERRCGAYAAPVLARAPNPDGHRNRRAVAGSCGGEGRTMFLTAGRRRRGYYRQHRPQAWTAADVGNGFVNPTERLQSRNNSTAGPADRRSRLVGRRPEDCCVSLARRADLHACGVKNPSTVSLGRIRPPVATWTRAWCRQFSRHVSTATLNAEQTRFTSVYRSEKTGPRAVHAVRWQAQHPGRASAVWPVGGPRSWSPGSVGMGAGGTFQSSATALANETPAWFRIGAGEPASDCCASRRRWYAERIAWIGMVRLWSHCGPPGFFCMLLTWS